MRSIETSFLSTARRQWPVFLTLALFLTTISAFAQGRFTNSAQSDFIRSNYTKFEYRIPMRDGLKLFTAVYVPNDTTQPYPILLLRTPYSVGSYGTNSYRGSPGPS